MARVLVTMRVALMEGCGIEKAVAEMLALADLASVNVETEMRGIRIVACPGDDAAEIVRAYREIDHRLFYAAVDQTKRKP